MVIEARYGEAAQRDLELFLATVAIVVVPLNLKQVHAALEAFRHYGKVVILPLSTLVIVVLMPSPKSALRRCSSKAMISAARILCPQ